MMPEIVLFIERVTGIGRNVPTAQRVEAMRHKFRTEAAALRRTSRIVARTDLIDEMIRKTGNDGETD